MESNVFDFDGNGNRNDFEAVEDFSDELGANKKKRKGKGKREVSVMKIKKFKKKVKKLKKQLKQQPPSPWWCEAVNKTVPKIVEIIGNILTGRTK